MAASEPRCFRGALSAHWLPLLIAAGLTGWFCLPWLGPGLPRGDFGGFASWLTIVGRHVREEGRLPSWLPEVFCGMPTVLPRTGLLNTLLYCPFLALGDAVAALKAGGVFFFLLSAAAAYWLAWWLLRSRSAAFLAAVAYALHPIHITLAARTGHMNFPPVYAAAPLVFLTFLNLGKRPTVTRAVFAASALSALFWLDSERMFILAPFLLLAAIAMHIQERGRLRSERLRAAAGLAGAVGAVGALWMAQTAFLLLPAYVEAGHHTLFSEDALLSSIRLFSLHNLLYLVDRHGAVVGPLRNSLPQELTYNSGLFYLGLVPLALCVTGFLVRTDAKSGRWKAIMFAVFGLLSVWLASGAYSYFERSGMVVGALLTSLPSANIAAEVGLVLLGGSLLVGWFFARHVVRNDPGRALLLGVAVPLALAAFAFVRPFMILRRLVPVYSHMRNPSWFMSVMPSLGLAIGVAGAWKALQKRFRLGRDASAGVVVLVTVFLLADYLPYRRDLGDREPAPALPDLMEALQAAAGPGRVLARESYNPLSDFGITSAGAANAWYWLNWASPRGMGRLVLDEIQPSLHKPQTIHRALLLCGIAHIRYVLYSLLEGPPPPSQEDLQPLKVTESYLLFENRLARDYVQVYPLEAASLSLSEAVPAERREGVQTSYRRVAPEKIEVSVSVPEKAVVMVAESYFPGWQVTVNGRSAGVFPFFGPFLGVTVSEGQSSIQLTFRTPWYHRLSLFISVGAWLAAGVWIVGSVVRRAPRQARMA